MHELPAVPPAELAAELMPAREHLPPPSAEHLLTGTLTFLMTDIEGSTRLWEQFPLPMQTSHLRHGQIIAQAVAACQGKLVLSQGEGDSTFAVFASAPSALAAACAIQQALHDEPWPPQAMLRVRIALHTGLAHLLHGDYSSPDINRCARLRAIGHGRQTLISATTAALVRDALPPGVLLKDMGQHGLKDLSRPEQVWQVVQAGLPSEFAPLRSLSTLAHNLPQQLTTLVGRERELEEIRERLAQTRLLTLTGVGGTGKTRLALQAAAEVAHEYPDGVWLADLSPLSDAALVPQALASVLDVREEGGRALTATLTDALRSKAMLLVLDNCEHLVDACAALAEALLLACPHIKVLTTSREALRIGGERVYTVPLMPSPQTLRLPATEAMMEEVGRYDSVRLFIERAQAASHTFVFSMGNASSVASVCRRLDGIPLALELAAARVRVLSVEQISQRLDDRFRLLTGGSRGATPRQQTLRAAIDWSYDLLSEAEQLLLARLSVFAGGCTLEAAEAVCADEQVEAWDVLDLLAGLVEKSLAQSEESEGGVRYRLLETLRQYGQERLALSGDDAALRGRHRDFFLALAEEAESHLTGPEQAAWLARLNEEHDNLRAAQAWSLRPEEDAEPGLRLAGALWRFWAARGFLHEGQDYLASALAKEDAPAVLRARSLYGAGVLAWKQCEYAHARTSLEECLQISQAGGDGAGSADALNILGLTATDQGDYETARRVLTESLALYRQVGDRRGTALALMNLGNVANNRCDYEAARALYEECLPLFRRLGDTQQVASTLLNMADTATEQGDAPAAQRLFEESLALYRQVGDEAGIAQCLSNLASTRLHQDDLPSARRLLREGLSVCARQGEDAEKTVIAHFLEVGGRLAFAEDDTAQTARLLGAAHALREHICSPPLEKDRERIAAALAAGRAQAGTAAWNEAWNAGLRLTPDAAIVCALNSLQ